MNAPDRTPRMLRLAARLLPSFIRDEVLGDLVEHWNQEVRHRGRLNRTLWLIEQPVAVAVARIRYGSPGAGSYPTSDGAGGFGFSLLDVKLAFRMLVKHPGLTLVVVFALGLGIPASLAPNHLADAVFDVSPPLDDGDRVVAVMSQDRASGTEELLHLADYELLRSRATSFESLGAALLQEVNVIGEDGSAAGARAALITASSFTLTRVPPLLGRTLIEADETPGGAEVVVISFDYWRARLGSPTDVVGTSLRIGGVETTIVGVMPEGFAFPSREQLWLPLRLRSIDFSGGLGPRLAAYGRLAPGVSRAAVSAELASIGVSDLSPDRQELTTPDISPFSALTIPRPTGEIATLLLIAQMIPLLLLVVACGNVAILVLARAANRSGEIALRAAIGASRGRIVGQLFVETLLLALLATGIGLAGVQLLVNRFTPMVDLPFWLELGVTPALVLKGLTLAVVSAVLAGVVPALRATGPELQRTLQRAGAGGQAFRFGRITGALVITEVALGVAALFAGGMTYQMLRSIDQEKGVEMESARLLVAEIGLPPDLTEPSGAARAARIAGTQAEIGEALLAQPEVVRWSFADATPGGGTSEKRGRIEGDGYPADFPGLPVVTSRVEPGFFTTLGIETLAGRSFLPGDAPARVGETPTRVLVNTKFLERRQLGLEAVGMMMRISEPGESPTGPWIEIIGIVPDVEASLGWAVMDGTPMAYLPAAAGSIEPLHLVIELRADASTFGARLRTLVRDADPSAVLSGVSPLADVPNGLLTLQRTASSILVGLSLIAIVLAMAALHALMAFTVARRTREIGVRVALGGNASRIMATVARRALFQLTVGAGLGAGLWAALFLNFQRQGGLRGELGTALQPWPWVLFSATAIVIVIGLVASLAPTLKGLRIRPVEALRVDV